ncbi:restriction endonuclease subunit S [uncultured Rhodoblastus sp.]|uniref:restriction endonuclease subunit S n=1 Tax=uncultured Rhodoblastus sp. TaxID=543037 RepID=UPI0025D17431|nr:restriction endonuclease subunit S [uncultured Rhodoblastus sp.]
MNSGWQIKKLGEVCVTDKTQGIHRNLPYVGLENIEAHTAEFIGSLEVQAAQSATFRFSQEHVLYGRLRPYLNKVFAPDFEGHCSTEIFPIRPNPRLLREFLLYWFLADETVNRINGTCTGARMPRANMNDVMEFEFPLPPLAEQRRIVSILDNALSGISAAKANVESNRKNVRSLFESRANEIFLQRGDGWIERTLATLCDIKHGFAFKSEFFTSSGDYTLLTPGNFYEAGGYRDRDEKQKYYCGEIPKGYVLSEGDLLVAMTEQAAGLLGSPALIPASGKFLHNQRLGLLTKKPDAPWINEFFFHVFNTSAVRKAIHDSASGVKVRHTSPTKIGEVIVAFPKSTEEQRAIVAQLSDLDIESQRLAAIYQQKIDALDELKKSLLHQAFSGQL